MSHFVSTLHELQADVVYGPSDQQGIMSLAFSAAASLRQRTPATKSIACEIMSSQDQIYRPKMVSYSQSSSLSSSFPLPVFFSSFGLPGARLVAPDTRS